MNENYIAQLKSPKWKEKRKQILQRDGYRCQGCYNEKLYNDLQIAIAEGVSPKISGKKYIAANIKNGHFFVEEFIPEQGKDFIYLVPKQIEETARFVSYVAKIKREDLEDLLSAIKSRSFKTFDKWIEFRGLHVHHTLYISDVDPWGYSDEHLVTYCSYCHEEFHQNNTVPILIKMDDGYLVSQTDTLKCRKCFGHGYYYDNNDEDVYECDLCK